MEHAADVLIPALLALLVYPAITGGLNWILWWSTAERWEAFAIRNPKRARLVRFLRAVNPHFRKAVEIARDGAASRSSLPPRPRADEVEIGRATVVPPEPIAPR